MTRALAIFLVAAVNCVAWVGSARAEDAVAPLTLKDPNRNVVRGFAQFQSAESTRDELYVTTPSGGAVTPTGVKVRQGDKDSIIFRLDGAQEGPGKHVAFVERRKGDSLYEVYGSFKNGGGAGGNGGPGGGTITWQADYASGLRRLIAFVNDAVDVNVAKATDFSNDDYLTVKMLGPWSDQYNPSENYPFLLTQDTSDTFKGRVTFQSSQGAFGWVSEAEFCDVRYIPIEGSAEGLVKIRATASGVPSSADTYAYVGDCQMVDGYNFMTMGNNRAGIVTNPPDVEQRLGYKYIYIPAECTINAAEHTSFAVLKLGPVPDVPDPESPASPLAAVYLMNGDKRVPCMRVKAAGDMFADVYGDYWGGWNQYVTDINSYQTTFGGQSNVSLDSMRAALMAAINAQDPDGATAVAEGRYWLSPPLTDNCPNTPMMFALLIRPDRSTNEGNGGTHPMVNAAAPDSRGKDSDQPRTPAAGAAASGSVAVPLNVSVSSKAKQVGQFAKLELDITLDEKYFCHKRTTTGTNLKPKARFDAYDADNDHNRIRVDVAAKPVDPPGPEINVPAFAMRRSELSPWEYHARLALPTKGTWELRCRALTWHTAPRAKDTQTDEDKLAAETFYHHYWGYADTVDDMFPAANNEDKKGNHHRSESWKAADRTPAQCLVKCIDSPPGQLHPLELAPEGRNRRLFYRDGSPVFLAGVSDSEIKEHRDVTQWLRGIKAKGVNFDNWWFAPWETMLTHWDTKNGDGEEQWSQSWEPGVWRPYPPETPADKKVKSGDDYGDYGWSEYGYYDQGRAQRMDRILEAHLAEGVYLGLVIWPHHALCSVGHNWTLERHYNGPEKPPGDRNGFSKKWKDTDEFWKNPVCWKWQKNLYRYILARYGWSPGVAMWSTVAEVEGTGVRMPTDDRGRPLYPSYWSGHKGITRPWHNKLASFLHDEDFRARPITGYGTWGAETNNLLYTAPERSPSLDFGCFGRGTEAGFAYSPEVSLCTNDPYPSVWKPNSDRSQAVNYDLGKWLKDEAVPHWAVWHTAVGRAHSWSKNNAVAMPHLFTEATVETKGSDDEAAANRLMRSYLHYIIWASLAGGHAGTPLQWKGPEEYEEAHAAATFANANIALLAALDTPISLNGEPIKATPQQPGTSPISFGMRSSDKKSILIYVFDDEWYLLQGRNRSYASAQASALKNLLATIAVAELQASRTYKVTAINTWSGAEDRACNVLDPNQEVTADASGKGTIHIGKLAETDRDAWDGADVVYLLTLKD